VITLDEYLLQAGIDHSIRWADRISVYADPDDHAANPYPHQLSGLNLAFAYNRVGIYDETGAGKTLPIQAYAIARAGQGHRVVALMPPILIDQFYESIHASFVPLEKYVKVGILRGTPEQRKKLVAQYDKLGWPDILLMTYNMFLGKKVEQEFDGHKVKLSDGYSSLLKKRYYNVLIADEAQILRNSESNIHKTVYKWIGGKDTDEAGLVLSTGTMAHTHLHQAYGMIRLVTPDAYSGRTEFERLHVQWDEYSEYDKVVSYSNYDILTANLYAQARRVTKAEVREDMPEKINTIIPVQLDEPHKALYKKLLKERLLILEEEFIDATHDSALRQLALRLISNPNSYSDKKIRNALDDALYQIIDTVGIDATKLLVFIHFNETADRLADMLKKYNPVVLNGQTKNRTKAKEKFLYDESCRIAICHPKSAGAGLNFQKVSSDSVFYECPDSPGDIGQAGDRTHRLNSTVPTNNYFLSPGGTWAAKKIRQVVKKDREINAVVQDKKALLEDLFDGL